MSDEEGILIKPRKKLRQGWSAAAQIIAESNEKRLLPDVFGDEKFEDWEW